MLSLPPRFFKVVGTSLIIVFSLLLLFDSTQNWTTLRAIPKGNFLSSSFNQTYRPTPLSAEPWTPEPRRLLVLQFWADDGQNLDSHPEISNLSVKQHVRYSAAHGYRYKVDRTAYLDASYGWASRFHNKIYAIMNAALDELALGDHGAEWIAYSDMDTIILDPSVAIHDLLPPPDFQSQPIFLGHKDGVMGFNAGVMTFRVCTELVEYLSDALMIHRDFLNGERDGTSHRGVPTDQDSLGLSLQRDERFAALFCEIPRRWMSTYTIEGMFDWAEDILGFKEDEYQPRMQIHLAGNLKTERDVESMKDMDEVVYTRARALAEKLGDPSNGLALLPEKQKNIEAARHFWNDLAKPGIEGMRWAWTW